ncbi:MAG TPA: TolC family protein [Verrucomicrobiae bacterium]|jgi:outer membrane protein TolC|nr:TolC family protein [Verrucomicrobiae bacterium]
MKTKSFCRLLLLLVLPVALAAADLPHHVFVPPSAALSLDWVLGEVQTNNPALKGAGANWRALRERVPQERAWADPRAGLDVKVARFVDVPADSFSDQTLFVEQTIPVAGKNRLRAHAATAEASAGGDAYRQRQLDLFARAQASYYRLANAYGQWEINRRSAGILEQIVEAARHKLESGQETQGAVLTAETEQANLEESAFDFERQVADEEALLNTLMNHPADAPLGRPKPPVFAEVDLPFDQVEAAALAHRPELLAASKKIEAARSRLEASRRNWIPEPSLRLTADRYNGASQAVDDVMASVAFDLPWFQHEKYAAATRENREILSGARYELDALRTETAQMVREQLTKIQTFRHHYELFRDKVAPLARQSIEASRISYEAGQAGLTQVLAARKNALESESMLLQHLTDYEIAVAELTSLAGASLAMMTNTPISTQQVKP